MGGCVSVVLHVRERRRKNAAPMRSQQSQSGQARTARKGGGGVYGGGERGGVGQRGSGSGGGGGGGRGFKNDGGGKRDAYEYDEEGTMSPASVSGRGHAACAAGEVGIIEADEDPRVDIRWSCGELIGAGAFGRVYMGMNLESGELMAVKQVSLSECEASRREDHVRALENEVAVLRRLRHVNIVRYLGTERTDDALNIFLEYVPGGSIHSLLVRFGSFGESVVRRYTRQILNGLHFLHKNQIVHRDIKGANILVDNTGVVKLADFGASKQIANLVTLDDNIKSIKGTPFWMAPEVIRQTGHGRQADVWSVGCTVIEMATGKAPWSQFTNQVSVMFHIASSKSPPPVPEHLSDDGKAFVRACLQRNPRDRATSKALLEYAWMQDCDSASTASAGRQQRRPVARVESTASSTTDSARARTGVTRASAGDDAASQREVKVTFGLSSPALSLSSTRYAGKSRSLQQQEQEEQQQQESSQQSDSGGWGSIDVDEIDCDVINTASSLATNDSGNDNDASRSRSATNANNDAQGKSCSRHDADAMPTPTSRPREEDDMILDYVREKAEGDCERLAPRNPDGSPLLLSSGSPRGGPSEAHMEAPALDSPFPPSPLPPPIEDGKENEHPSSPGASLRQSKEQMWEEELRRELEAERLQLSLRQ